MYMQRGVYLQR